MKRRSVVSVLLCVPLILLTLAASDSGEILPIKKRRDKAMGLYRDGNYKEAYEIYSRIVLGDEHDPRRLQDDFNMAVSCLQRLNRRHETDAFREKAVETHPDHWHLLKQAAISYFGATHYGYIVAGEFHRGHHRGGGRYVNSYERDRVRALQLLDKSMARTEGKALKQEIADLYFRTAQVLLGYRGHHESWRLQYLTDLSTLPDYEDGHGYRHGGTRGAPVDENGDPVFHRVPAGYAEADTDGERWRWLLAESLRLAPGRTNEILTQLASFLHNQFGVQTMASYGLYGRGGEDSDEDESGPYAVHTLKDNETIARLATGIKRFELPDEFNFIRIYRKIADNRKAGYGEGALNTLAGIFENRRHYDDAAETWQRNIKEYGEPKNKWKTKKIDQIVGNWGQFEPVGTHPSGQIPTVEYRFRNARKVTFEAHEIHVRRLLDDVKAYLRANPRKLDHNKVNVGNIGYRLVSNKEHKYVGKKVTAWEMTLAPGTRHFDKRITVAAPLKKAGAYLLTAKLADGNVSKIVMWVNDTVIVRKQLDKASYFFVADAVTGEPLPRVNVEFFGYRQQSVKWEKVIGRHYNVITDNFAEFTDEQGQVILSPEKLKDRFNWIISATTKKGRLAYLGFSRFWYGRYHDEDYNRVKVYTITDRPVYRPDQPVKFKLWVRHARYDKEQASFFANHSFTVRINDPKGEKILEKTFKADAYGGFDGEYMLPGNAALGVYSIFVPGKGGGSFRVEEYKKPEFEVTVDAPTEPVMLGERITAKIHAKYYFGAPVTHAKVKVKVLRSPHDARWYPAGIWDWFYGPGYWWFAYDYPWYPGWYEWGCLRPRGWWWPHRTTPPEIVAEAELEIGEDGTVQVPIDTLPAKELHGNQDHRYEITAEVTDMSRRTIVGKGTVLVARKPFKVYAWVNRGHYRVGDVVHASFSARTLDSKPVQGAGEAELFRITYRREKRGRQTDRVPVETSIRKWDLDTDDEGRSALQLKASQAGQYRIVYRVTDSKKHTIEGGYVFVVRGEGFDGKQFRFNEVELVPEKREYAPGEKVRLMISTDRADSTVVLFLRPANGIYLKPEIIRIKGKNAVKEIDVTKKDMPNFFVEAFTIDNGRLFAETKEIIVPPERRVLNVEVLPEKTECKPGEKAQVRIRVTDIEDKPFVGSTVVTMYDRSVEYISGGSNVPEIKKFFWKWRRRHNPSRQSSFDRYFGNLSLPGKLAMQNVGAFGHMVPDEEDESGGGGGDGRRSYGWVGGNERLRRRSNGARMSPMKACAPTSARAIDIDIASEVAFAALGDEGEETPPEPATVEPVVRTKFADTAFWAASLLTDENGVAEFSLDMPENLTGWKIRTWSLGHGTVVGEGTAEVVTKKNLLLRLQAPRFFVEKDEVVLSANVHNYLESDKDVTAILELDGPCLEMMGAATQEVTVTADGELRVDWRVKVVREGEAVVRMKALTDEESDAMEMRFPVYVHGMLKTESFCGVIRPEGKKSFFEIVVPGERRIEQSRLEIRYSPTLAGAMVDALPYLAEYPYGCTEQTLNRFLPAVITQKVLKDMGLDLAAIREKRTNLNAQEIGDDVARAKQWKRWDRNPVFDEAVVDDMVRLGLKRLYSMQLSDGGWGWFSGWGERSYPHTTAYVVHGFQVAEANGMALVPGVLSKGVRWLKKYQAEQVRLLKNADKNRNPRKTRADNLDAFVYMVLADAGIENDHMRKYLYRDRVGLAHYAKAMFALALHKQEHADQRDMVVRNIEQFLVRDDENQTVYLEMQNGSYWWYWYGSEYEAHAYYLKLLSALRPKSPDTAGLVKYLLNNRKHATYWNSTRDTAICIEAMADYLRASGEDKPDMTVEILIDGRTYKEVRITPDNLFSFDNKLVLEGDAVRTGKHRVEVRRKGTGPVYFNAYLTNFTLEDHITRAGLEVKVNRRYFRLKPVEKTIKVAGSRGQVTDQKVEKYEREPLANLDRLKSGDLVEIELVIESKNDYEYLVFEDMKAAGFEPVDVRSGYGGNDMGAYMELRDERVAFFVRALARGKHSLSYRMRAEIPGRFSALPTRAYAMYAPELKANSDEIKLQIED